VLLILAAITIPCFVDTRVAANESTAVGSLRTITTAQLEFSKQYPTKGFAASLAELGPTPGDNQIDAALASGAKSGYVFALTPAALDSAGHITKFTVTATPQTFEKTGARNFFVDESGVIRATPENRRATASDPALQ
jgi:hypothetical protein